jgi:hypothetical protein
MATEVETDKTFEDLVRRAEHASERLNGHYTFRVKKWLTPFLSAGIGALLAFVISTQVDKATQSLELQNESKQIAELKEHTISKEVFQATVQPINENIADIKQSLEELHRLRLEEQDQKVIYKTYKVARSN